MKYVLPLVLLLGGCGDDAAQNRPAPAMVPVAAPAVVPNPAAPQPHPLPWTKHLPDDLWQSAGTPWFDSVGDSWMRKNSVNWQYMSPEKIRAATGMSSDDFVRNEIGDVRLCESYREAGGDIQWRWQEERIKGVWRKHGPYVLVHLDGSFDVGYHRLDEFHGPRTSFNKEGAVVQRQTFDNGIPVGE